MKTKFVAGPLPHIILACCLLLGTASGFGQGKEHLTEKEYSLWGTTQLYAASGDARWVAYTTRYENGMDTLTLQHTLSAKQYRYPGGSSVLFGKGGFALVGDAAATLHLRYLDSGKQVAYKNVTSYGLSADASSLFMLQEDTLSVVGLKTNIRRVIPAVSAYSYNAAADALAYTLRTPDRSQVVVLHLSPSTRMEATTVAESGTHAYSNLVWSKGGGEIAFEQHPFTPSSVEAKGRIGFYHLKSKALFEFNPARQEGFPQRDIISCTFLKPLSISDDGSKVFFGIAAGALEAGNPTVEIWNTGDKFLYPAKEEIQNWDAVAKVAVWWPHSGRFYTPVHNHPTGMLTGDQRVLLSFDPGQYEPQNNFRAPVDITLTYLETGEKKTILEQWAYSPPYLQVSPAGGFILYWKENNWWVYDLNNERHHNLTGGLPAFFYNPDFQHPSPEPPFGFAGWSSDDAAVFLYDRHNIWKIATDGSNPLRITNSNGATTFRLVLEPAGKGNLDGYAPVVIDTRAPLAIKEYAAAYTCLHTWQQGRGLVKIATEAGEITSVIPDSTYKNWLYVFQNYQVAPTVRLKNAKQPIKTIYKSNPQQERFQWGRAELIEYKDPQENELKAILYYPADYDPNRRYPMIVHIYETQSRDLFAYINPSLYNHTGFNITNLLVQGYFVLLPDITYQIGRPGQSAQECTLAALRRTLEIVPVDPGRIGLIGHSWGGYETDYIISKTPMFKAAVAGAAITDFTSDYFSVVWNLFMPSYYKAEVDQHRLGKAYFEDPQMYQLNSPLSHADQITTPLLSWAGKQDKQVDIGQTIELHMALRRLGKKNIMLLYPGERHVLMQREHQADLTRRTESWFGHYLKGEAEPLWCKVDVIK
ncbi:prolyl oligopeptidase family serine peptidase [Flavobacterium sp. Sd200]|uniref:alpha/beta hydrolase family protein n=1 Tax=Flavobacterium sp. Sd200 TaxID=2692211 RepID=UPI0013700A00|nr:prolyl oligopeptidase family serine peptidase [Flavobacterium sp. Sd200]MXN91693.1 prolyl oligopeptidase family serine peptidase [Flavobacterium sp. Sd200]